MLHFSPDPGACKAVEGCDTVRAVWGNVHDAGTTLCQCEGQCECLDEVSAISHFLDGVTKNKAIEPLFKNIHDQISKDPEHKWLATALAAAIRQETQPWQQDPELDTVRWMRALGTLKKSPC